MAARKTPYRWAPDYTSPPRRYEVVFIGGHADGVHRIIEDPRPWVQVMVFKGMPSLAAAYAPSDDPPVAVSVEEIYSQEVYERQEFRCGDEQPGEDRPILFYTLRGMSVREAFKRLMDGYAPRRDDQKVVVR